MSRRTEQQAPQALSHRLSCRMTAEDAVQLDELRLALHLSTPAQALRTIIRMSHAAHRDAIRRAKRDVRQLKLFGGTK